MLRNCLYCNSEFEVKKPKAKFCSAKCRVYSNRKLKFSKPKKKGRPKIEKLDKPKIDFKALDKQSYDGSKINPLPQDEMGQMQTTSSKWFRRPEIPKPANWDKMDWLAKKMWKKENNQ